MIVITALNEVRLKVEKEICYEYESSIENSGYHHSHRGLCDDCAGGAGFDDRLRPGLRRYLAVLSWRDYPWLVYCPGVDGIQPSRHVERRRLSGAGPDGLVLVCI